ncbi:MAG: DNA-deoxyinosine glycosylase [Bacteroidales bacterium]
MNDWKRMINEKENIKRGLPPVADSNSRILILGTFPSEQSLTKQQYYANPQNYFWKIMFEIFKQNFTNDYEKRLQLLVKHKIALWDVIAQCERNGSSDNKIKNEKANDLKSIIKQYPNITHLLFNGIKPVEYFVKHKMSEGRLTPVPSLPSTSPANTHLPLEEKIECWSAIKYLLR